MELFEFIDGLEGLALELQTEITRRVAVGPTDNGPGELERAEYLAGALAGLGFPEVRWLKAPDSRVACGFRPSLYTVVPGRDASRTLWVASHLDTVPPGDRELWESEPFSLRREGDRLYGRGVEDNQQGLVSSILAGYALLRTGTTPACNFGLLLLADEEDMSEFGAHYLLEQRPDILGPNDEFLVPDGGDSRGSLIEVTEKHMLWIKFTVRGQQCHASMPQMGVNTLKASAALIMHLDKLYELYPDRDELYAPPQSTFSPTRKDANTPNVACIPGCDVFYFDCRILPRFSIEEVLASVRELAGDIERAYGVRIETEEFRRSQNMGATATDAPVVRKNARAVQAVYGVEPVYRGVGVGTVATFFRNKGYASTVWSRLLVNPHVPNECSLLSYTLGDAKVMAAMAVDEADQG